MTEFQTETLGTIRASRSLRNVREHQTRYWNAAETAPVTASTMTEACMYQALRLVDLAVSISPRQSHPLHGAAGHQHGARDA